MKAFQTKNDENRIYFRNYDRIPADQELSILIKELEAAGCLVGARRETGLVDLYDCRNEDMNFNIVFDEEQAFIYSESEETIKRLISIF